MRAFAVLPFVLLVGCEPSREDRLLACLKGAGGKYAAMACQANFGPPGERPQPRTVSEPAKLNVADLEWKWTQPYLGSTLDDGTPSQHCLRAFDLHWSIRSAQARHDALLAESELVGDEDDSYRRAGDHVNFDSYFDRMTLGFERDGLEAEQEAACYVNDVVLADCRYCDAFRQRDEAKRATLERRRRAASGESS